MRLSSRAAKLPSSRFQSTHSLRSATCCANRTNADRCVSIHALLAECDTHPSPCQYATSSFNPRTPCGVRPALDDSDIVRLWFQSTHSLRSATPRYAKPGSNNQFQSTHSLRSATAEIMGRICYKSVSIHALLAECDYPG